MTWPTHSTINLSAQNCRHHYIRFFFISEKSSSIYFFQLVNAVGNQKTEAQEEEHQGEPGEDCEEGALLPSSLGPVYPGGRHAGKNPKGSLLWNQEPGALRDLPVEAVGSSDLIAALSHLSRCRYLIIMNEIRIYDRNCAFNPRCEE